MALKSSSQTLGEAFAGVGQAKKIAFDIETLQSAADIINTRLEQSQADYTKKKQKTIENLMKINAFGKKTNQNLYEIWISVIPVPKEPVKTL